jgi:ketosteroid isomerase-like protein
MSDEDRNKALLHRFYEELWSQGDLEAIPELVAENFVDHHALPGAPPGREGLAALVTTWRTAFPDMRETVEDLVAEGDRRSSAASPCAAPTAASSWASRPRVGA